MSKIPQLNAFSFILCHGMFFLAVAVTVIIITSYGKCIVVSPDGLVFFLVSLPCS